MSSRRTKNFYLSLVSVFIMTFFLAFFSETTFTDGSGTDPTVLGRTEAALPIYEDKLLFETASKINQERSIRALPKLNQSAVLDKIAQKRADDMLRNGFYAHKGSDGKFFSDIMKDQTIGYRFACENLNILEVGSSEKFVSSWLASPDHKDCLLKNTHQYAGYATVTVKSLSGIGTHQQIIVAIYSDSDQ